MKKVSLNLIDFQDNQEVIGKIMDRRSLSHIIGGNNQSHYAEIYSESTYVRKPTLPTKPAELSKNY